MIRIHKATYYTNERRSKHEKALSLLLVIALTAAIAIGGTLAYLTDRDNETNVFTMGNVDIELNEKFEQGAELMPGVRIQKETTITNTGDNDAWVWLTISVPAVLDDENAELGSANILHWNMPGCFWNGYHDDQKYIASGIKDGYLPEGSTGVADEDSWINENKIVGKETIDGVEYNVYAFLYKGAIIPGESTNIALSRVFIDENVDIAPDGQWYTVEGGEVTKINWNSNTNGTPVVYTNAYAIQKDNFADVEAAYEAYVAQWGKLNGEHKAPTVVTNEAELVAASKVGGNVMLGNDIVLSQELYLWNTPAMNLVGNGYTITASENYQKNIDGGQYNLVKIDTPNAITLENVTLKHVALAQTESSYHTLDIANSPNVTLSNVTLIRDFEAAKAGAPLIVNASSVVAKNDVTIVAGGNAWYGLNVDGSKGEASLTIESGAKASFAAGNWGYGVIQNGGTFTDNSGKWYVNGQGVVVPVAVVSTTEELTAALENGGKITLSEDVTLAANTVIDQPTEIELGGNALTVDYLSVTSELTVSNGAVNADPVSNVPPIWVKEGAKAELNNVNIEVYAAVQDRPGDAFEGFPLYITGGEAVMNGGSIKNTVENQSGWNYGVVIVDGVFTMNGGIIEVDNCMYPTAVAMMGGTFNHNGGVLNAASWVAAMKNTTNTINTTDSTFTEEKCSDYKLYTGEIVFNYQ